MAIERELYSYSRKGLPITAIFNPPNSCTDNLQVLVNCVEFLNICIFLYECIVVLVDWYKTMAKSTIHS